MLSPRSTLILYLYAHDNVRQRNKGTHDNLRFFVQNGLASTYTRDDVFFSFLLSGSKTFSIDLPARHNVRMHSIAKLDSRLQLSQIKAFLDSPEQFPGCATDQPECQAGGIVVEWQKFDRFVILSDVVRGPFMPPYQPLAAWPEAFLTPLSDSLKLVSATVACEDCGKDLARCATRLHAESTVLGTDQVGLRILLRRWQVHGKQSSTRALNSWAEGKWAEIQSNEIGGPVAIRQSGFNMGAHMRYWEGHDFRDVNLTARKCARLVKHSVRLIALSDRQVKPIDGKHETNLHSQYLGGGGSNCKGCYFGFDLPPTETMFTHWYTSPGMAYGAIKGYAEMDKQLDLVRRESAAMESSNSSVGLGTSSSLRRAQGWSTVTFEGNGTIRISEAEPSPPKPAAIGTVAGMAVGAAALPNLHILTCETRSPKPEANDASRYDVGVARRLARRLGMDPSSRFVQTLSLWTAGTSRQRIAVHNACLGKPWRGYRTKIPHTHACLRDLISEGVIRRGDLAMTIDAGDVIFNLPALTVAEVHERFEAARKEAPGGNARIVFAAEAWCWSPQ
jgi:hypothetical protein